MIESGRPPVLLLDVSGNNVDSKKPPR